MKPGLFIVLEGIDGSGTSTQRTRLYNHFVRISDSREDITTTREPWRSDEIKKRLETDRDAYSGAVEMASLYINDRVNHSNILIKPNLALGCHVLSDRYILSTLAYQQVQDSSVKLDELIEMHYGKGLLVPDVTFLIDVSAKTAMDRIKKRPRKKEKFEDEEFLEKVRLNYLQLAESRNKDLGKIVIINGKRSIVEISKGIISNFDLVYSHWKDSPTRDIKTI